mmetsp:Transcript_64651/g.148641  ORF Transcript_64651/g.148641 Transcript_64651/m.148641 type:complete len:393 (+) Transcript_64651:35-1213(+)
MMVGVGIVFAAVSRECTDIPLLPHAEYALRVVDQLAQCDASVLKYEAWFFVNVLEVISKRQRYLVDGRRDAVPQEARYLLHSYDDDLAQRLVGLLNSMATVDQNRTRALIEDAEWARWQRQGYTCAEGTGMWTSDVKERGAQKYIAAARLAAPPPGGIVLDFGAGCADRAAALREALGVAVVAMDPSVAAMRHVTEAGLCVDGACAGGLDLVHQLPRGAFDLVLANGVLPAFKFGWEACKLLKSLLRLVRRGGVVWLGIIGNRDFAALVGCAPQYFMGIWKEEALLGIQEYGETTGMVDSGWVPTDQQAAVRTSHLSADLMELSGGETGCINASWLFDTATNRSSAAWLSFPGDSFRGWATGFWVNGKRPRILECRARGIQMSLCQKICRGT